MCLNHKRGEISHDGYSNEVSYFRIANINIVLILGKDPVHSLHLFTKLLKGTIVGLVLRLALNSCVPGFVATAAAARLHLHWDGVSGTQGPTERKG